MKQGLRVVDADGHTMDPPAINEQYLDPKWRPELARHVSMQLVPGSLEALRLEEQLHTKYAEFTDSGWDARVLVKGLDVEGVDISVIYGPLYSMWADGMDPRFAAALARGYNRWLADYSADSGGRVQGAGAVIRAGRQRRREGMGLQPGRHGTARQRHPARRPARHR